MEDIKHSRSFFPRTTIQDIFCRIDFKSTVKDFEIALLRRALEQNQFNQKKAAETLGLSYHQLRGYLRKYDLLG